MGGCQNTEEEENTDKDKPSDAFKKTVTEDVAIYADKAAADADKAATDALAAADAVPKTVAVKEGEAMKTVLDDPEAKAKYYKAIYEEGD